MKDLKELLGNPFEGLTNDEIQKKCANIAKELFNNYCIKCKDSEYYFTEIEFYYYEKSKRKEEWTKVTYPRDGYSAKELCFHTSGIDICFDSFYDNARFGGILIRSIMDKNDNIIAGPWNCMLQILKACKGGGMPTIEESQRTNYTPNIKTTYRALGEKDMVAEKKSSLSLCFYDAIPADKWNFVKESFDKANCKRIYPKTYYKKERFSL